MFLAHLAIFIFLILFFWIFYRFAKINVCSICSAAVSTWIIGVIFIYIGSAWADVTATAILMGASVGALAEKFGKSLGFLWKTLFVLLGFVGVYFLLNELVSKFFVVVLLLLAVTFLSNISRNSVVGSFGDKFKNCC